MKRFLLLLLAAMPFIMAAAPKGSSNTSTKGQVMTAVITKIIGTPDWDNIPVLPIDRVLWTEDTGVRALGQLCYDEENLYAHLRAFEKDIRAENTEPLSPVHEDSCLEFFFSLDGLNRYFNFEINPNGCACIQFGPSRADRINIVRKEGETYFDIQTGRTSDGWEVFYRIPLGFIHLFYPDYHFGGEIAANLYKCGDKTANRHYLSWSPVELDKPDFHRPEFFGRLSFE